MFKNSEGYSDPTAGAAISNVMKKYKKKQLEIWRQWHKTKRKPKDSRNTGDIEANVPKQSSI